MTNVMNKDFIVKASKLVVGFCVERTVSTGLKNVTYCYGDSKFTKVVKFVGREALSVAIVGATKGIIEKEIDDLADKISDIIVEVKAAKEEYNK